MTIFLTSDVITFLIQAAGGGISIGANDNKGAQLGSNVFLAGLAIQLLSFLLFTVLFVVFVFRVRKYEPSVWRMDGKEGKVWYEDWRALTVAVGFSCVGILVRIRPALGSFLSLLYSVTDQTAALTIVGHRSGQSTVPSNSPKASKAPSPPTKASSTDSTLSRSSSPSSSIVRSGLGGSSLLGRYCRLREMRLREGGRGRGRGRAVRVRVRVRAGGVWELRRRRGRVLA